MGDQLMGTNAGASSIAQYSYPDKLCRADVGRAERALIPMAHAACLTTQISLQSGETQ
jgi:hypothetical protein